MLKIQEIRELIKLIDKSSIDEFQFENDGEKIVLKKNEVKIQQAAEPQAPAAVPFAPPAQTAPSVPAQPAPKNRLRLQLRKRHRKMRIYIKSNLQW